MTTTSRSASVPTARLTASRRGPPPVSAACPTGRCTMPPRSPFASTTCRRSRAFPVARPAEGMIAQAVVGINGVTLGQYGSIAVDPHAVDPCAPVVTDLAHDALRRDADVPRRRRRPWRARPGEVAVRRPGHARRGADPHRRGRRRSPFAVAGRAVRAHITADRRRRSPTALPRLAADRRPRRAVVRRPDARRVPDRARPGDRPAVGGDGGASSRSPRSACTAAPRSTSPSLLAAGPDVLSVPVQRRARRRWPATSCASSRAAAGSRGGRCPPTVRSRPAASGRGASSATCGASSSQRGCDPVAAAPAQPRHAALRARPAHARPSPTGCAGSPARSAGGSTSRPSPAVSRWEHERASQRRRVTASRTSPSASPR